MQQINAPRLPCQRHHRSAIVHGRTIFTRPRLACSARRQNDSLPQKWSEVGGWARQEFDREVSSSKRDDQINLGRACLLIALEEEAAIELHPELESELRDLHVRFRSMATSSTWSLERLDSLAAEVKAHFLHDIGTQETAAAASPASKAPQPTPGSEASEAAAASGASGLAPCSREPDASDAPDALAGPAPGSGVPEAPAMLGAPESNASGAAVASAVPGVQEPALLSQGSEPAAVPEKLEPAAATPASTLDPQQPDLEPLPMTLDTTPCSPSISSSPDGPASACTSTPISSIEHASNCQEPGQAGPTHAGSEAPSPSEAALPSSSSSSPAPLSWSPELAERHIVRLLHAVNSVLFERHGYAACNRYGVPRDAQLSSVMESGVGCSAALSILYLEVCSRLGLHMAAKPLEEGRYFVLWPTSQPIVINSHQFVVDPYGCGGLLLVSEVCELFDVDVDTLWRPASRRQLLASLLCDLRDSHWARAVGCSPNPGLLTPISLETALSNKVGSVNVHSVRRALAASEKRLGLLPNDRAAQLELALLQYFCRNYDDAWIELGILLEKQQQQRQQVESPRAETGQQSNEATGAADVPQAAAAHGSQDQFHGSPGVTGPEVPGDMGLREQVEQPLQAGQGSSECTDSAPPLSASSSKAEDVSAWVPLDDIQLQQVRILLEKCRLQLAFAK